MEDADIQLSVASPSPSSSAGPVGTGPGRGSVQVWTRDSIPGDLWLPVEVERMSSCELEVDALFSDIMNRLHIGGKITYLIFSFNITGYKLEVRHEVYSMQHVFEYGC